MKDLIRLILREETIGDEQVKNRYRYWTFDKVKQEAEKYNTKWEFSKGSAGAYGVALRNNWLDDVTKHMTQRSSQWTYDKVKQEAEKYDTKAEFIKNNHYVYRIAHQNNWLDDITKHMTPRFIWTYDRVKKEAEKYNTRSEFAKNNVGAYNSAVKNNWLDDVTKHMEVVGNKYYRLIYSFEFPDKSVYVGLTYNEKERYASHMRDIKSAVYRYMKETGLEPVFKKETHYLSKENAVRMEEYIEDWYRQNGWKILNVNKTGGLGSSNLFWTFDNVKQEAQKYNTKTEFRKGKPGAYNSAVKNNWIDDVTKHMISKDEMMYNKVKQEAEKYRTKTEFMRKNQYLYYLAVKNNWIDDVTKHMISKDEMRFDKIKQEAEKYNKRTEFWKGSPSAYTVASKNNWLNDFFPKNQR